MIDFDVRPGQRSILAAVLLFLKLLNVNDVLPAEKESSNASAVIYLRQMRQQ